MGSPGDAVPGGDCAFPGRAAGTPAETASLFDFRRSPSPRRETLLGRRAGSIRGISVAEAVPPWLPGGFPGAARLSRRRRHQLHV